MEPSNKRSKKSKVVDDEDEEMLDAEPTKPQKMITPAILNEIAGVVPPDVVEERMGLMMLGPLLDLTDNHQRISLNDDPPRL